jgi:hypothetical protein
MRIPPNYRYYSALCLVPAIGLLLASCQNPQPIMPGGSVPPPNVAITTQMTPPAPQSESIPPAPPGPPNYFAWEPGHWHWYETGFIWIPGHYTEQPYQGSSWTHGNWSYDGNLNWTWTPGYWH